MKFTPHQYQVEAIKKIVSRNHCGLFLDPGMGKTSSTLAAFKILKSKGLVKKMLILAPLRVCYSVWPAEIKKWDDFSDLKIVVLHGKDKERLLTEPCDVVMCNYEAIDFLTSNGNMAKLGADMLVFDESTKMKNGSTKRFKMLKPYLSKFNRRVVLTGTPVPNGLMDLWAQVYCMDLGNSLGRYITHYRMSHFYPSGFGGYEWKLQPGAEQRIYDAIAPAVLRLSAKDHLDLPDLVTVDMEVVLPEKAMKHYRELELAFITTLDGERLYASSAATASSKCRQLASGALYKSDLDVQHIDKSEDWVYVHDAKIQALVDLVDELQGSPLLLGYEFNHSAYYIRKALPQAVFASDHPGKKFDDVLAAFNRGEIAVLACNPASVGHGVNAQAKCNHVGHFDQIWNLEYYDQFNARIWRQGNSSDRVIVHRIVAKNTIDEVVVKALANKDRTQTALLDALRDYAKEKY